jgi:P27 family predicted phage terminase small subunit
MVLVPLSVHSIEMPRRSAAYVSTPRFELVRSTPLDLPAPPAHLSEPTQAWWRAVVADYELMPHHLRLLEAAADAWERMLQARAVLQEEGLMLATEHGPRKHPAVGIEHDAAIRFARLMRELDFDGGPRPELYARLPGLRSNRRGA